MWYLPRLLTIFYWMTSDSSGLSTVRAMSREPQIVFSSLFPGYYTDRVAVDISTGFLAFKTILIAFASMLLSSVQKD